MQHVRVFMSYRNHFFLVVGLGLGGFFSATCADVISQGQDVFTSAAEQLKEQDLSSSDRAKIAQTVNKVNASEDTAFTEEELIAGMDRLISSFDNKLTPEMLASMKASMRSLAKRLAKFKITGYAVAFDPNGAFFVDTQDPLFDVEFKNKDGEIKTRKVQANIETIGLKVQFSLNWNFIFFVGTDLNYLGSSEVLELGTGFEFDAGSIIDVALLLISRPDLVLRRNSIGLFNLIFTYAPFKKVNGGLFMASGCFGLPGGSLSIVTGGSLTPVA